MPTTRPSSRETHRALPDAMREAVDEFALHLSAERNRSANTIRAYVGDTVSLLDHAVRMGVTSPDGLTIGVLRSWLARLRSTGAARASLARRAAAARTFTAWPTAAAASPATSARGWRARGRSAACPRCCGPTRRGR